MVLTWPPRKCVLLLGFVLVHAHVANNVGVSAQQQPLVISGVTFDLLSATPSPTPTSTPKNTKKTTTKLTMAPAIATTTTKTTTPATTAPVVTTKKTPAPVVTTKKTPAPVVTTKKTPAPTSKKPAVNADAAVNADTAVNAATGSSGGSAATGGGASSAGVSGTNSSSSAQPTVAPSPSPMPVVSFAAPAPTTATPAPASSHDCGATSSNLINKFYENNDVLEGDCAAANNYYRFPFEGLPSREQLINMSKTSACTVLMEALLQILPTECDFKRVALRSTAEAILQLAKDIKQKGTETLPSDKAITQAIETRRKDLLKISATESATVATATGSSGSATPKAADATTTSTSSGSGWKIADGITSVMDDGQHILMDKDLLVVGTWSDNAESSENAGAPASATKPSSSSSDQKRTETLDTKVKTKNGSGSLQFAALSVHAVFLLSWIFL